MELSRLFIKVLAEAENSNFANYGRRFQLRKFRFRLQIITGLRNAQVTPCYLAVAEVRV